jgi:hypothetical protein
MLKPTASSTRSTAPDAPQPSQPAATAEANRSSSADAVGRLTSTFCAVCEKCGFHRRVANLQDLPNATSNATAKRLGDLETHVRELRAQTRKLFAQRAPRKDTR